MREEKISLVIPTCNREKDLNRLFVSVFEQTLFPNEIIVIDDAELSMDVIERYEFECKKRDINFIFFKKDHDVVRKGLAESKNLALKLVSNPLIMMLDDDLVLDSNFVQQIYSCWKENADTNLLGVGGIISNNRRKSWIENIYNFFFSLRSRFAWDVTSVGYQVWNDHIDNPQIGFFSHGGVTMYNVNILKKLGGFEVFDGGRTSLEDVDLCIRAKQRGYYLFINPSARVQHNSGKYDRDTDFEYGFKEGKNRREIFLRNCKTQNASVILFVWSSLGWLIRQFLCLKFAKGFGMIDGYIS